MTQKDELAGVIADELNKTFKHQKVAYFLDDGANPTDVTDWISTGSTILDLAIANKPNAGVPVGKITELYTEPSYDELKEALAVYLNPEAETDTTTTSNGVTATTAPTTNVGQPKAAKTDDVEDAFDSLFNS